MSPRSRSGRVAAPLAAFGLALALFVPGARAAPVPALHVEDLVPGRSLAFLSMENVGQWGERAKDLALVRMFSDPEMKAFLAPIQEDLEKMTAPGGDSPLPPVALEALKVLSGLHGQVGVALVDVDRERGPVLAAGLDFGDKLSEFVTFAARMKEQMGDDLPLTTQSKDGRVWWTMGDPERPMVHGTTLRTSVLVSTDRAWLEQVTASDAARVAGSLGEAETFRRTRTSAGGDALAVFLYANVPSVLELATQEAGPDARRVMDAVGLDTMKAAAYGMTLRGDGILDTIVVDAPGADHGLMPMMKMRPATHRGLAGAPAGAFLFEESTFALSTALGRIREIVGKIDPDVLEEVEKALAEANSATGVDLEKDLLGALADDLAYHLSVPETGGLYPEFVLSLAVKDPATFEATASKAVDGLLGHVGRSERLAATQRVVEYRGKRLHVIDLSATRGDDVVPFTPTWALLGDRWVVTLVPHTMKEVIHRMESPGKGLAGEEDFQALMAGGLQGAGDVSYVDLQAVLNLLYDTAVPVLQTVAKPNVLRQAVPFRFDWALLPSARSMRPYFRSLGAFVECDGQTLKVAVHSPTGIVLPAAVVGVAAATFLRPVRRMGGMMPEIMVEPDPTDDTSTLIAEVKIQGLVDTVLAYRLKTGRLPASLAQLAQETNPDTDAPWLERLASDPWGNAFEYVVRDAAKGQFEIRSLGKDGVPNSLDDLVHVVSDEDK